MTTYGTWKVLEPESYYRSYIEAKKRPDGRSWLTSRKLLVKAGSITTAEGSATVRMGNTSVVCGIKAEICTPSLREPDKGYLVPNVELYPCCSPAFKTGPPGEKAMITSNFLQSVLKNSGFIDLKSLCIVPKKVAWCLYCDIVCIDYDGNLNDASLVAMIVALRNVRLPTVEWDEDKEVPVVGSNLEKQLCLKGIPVATTFSLYSDDINLIDPTYEDERECSGEVTLVFLDDGSLCTIHKPGGHSVSVSVLERFQKIAKNRANKIIEIVKNAEVNDS